MPHNQLKNLNIYQQRVVASIDKLNLPKWSQNTGTMNNTRTPKTYRKLWENTSGYSNLLNTSNNVRRSLTPSQRFRYNTQHSTPTPNTASPEVRQNKPISWVEAVW